MRYESSHLVVLFGLLPVFGFILYFGFLKRKRLLAQFGSRHLWEKLAPSLSPTRRFWKKILFLVAITGVIVCLMRPQYGVKFEHVQRKGVDIFIAIDTSLSMAVQDVLPSRFAHAKQEVVSLVNSLQGNRVGLIVFSGTALVQCPLTLDYAALRLFLDDINVGMLPVPGTNVAEAIAAAVKSMKSTERRSKVLVLVTDGESFGEDPIEAAASAKKEGIKIYTVGIGTASGDPIPLRDNFGNPMGYKTNKQGEVVLSKLNEPVLRQIAAETGGQYYLSHHRQLAMESVYRAISSLEKSELKDQVTQKHEDRYQILLILVFLVLILEMLLSEKKRVQTIARVLIFLFFLPHVIQAQTLQEYVQNKKGISLYHKGKIDKAVSSFSKANKTGTPSLESLNNLGTAYYGSKENEKAENAYLQALKKSNGKQADVLYNLGNLYFQKGDLDKTVSSYKEALVRNPKDFDAKHNLEMALNALKAKQEQSQKDEKQSDKKEASQQDQPRQKPGEAQKAKDQVAQQQKDNEEKAKEILNLLEQKEKEAREKYIQNQFKFKQRDVDIDW